MADKKVTGVFFRSSRNVWVAHPHIDGVPVFLGSFSTREAAETAVSNYKETGVKPAAKKVGRPLGSFKVKFAPKKDDEDVTMEQN